MVAPPLAKLDAIEQQPIPPCPAPALPERFANLNEARAATAEIALWGACNRDRLVLMNRGILEREAVRQKN